MNRMSRLLTYCFVSSSLITTGLANTAGEDIRAMAYPGHRPTEFLAQFGARMTADVQQLDMLQIVPDALHRIKFRSLARQPHERNAASCAIPEKRFYRSIMNRSAVPDDEQLPCEVVQQMFEKPDDIRAAQRALLPLHKHAALQCQRANQ